MDQVSMTSAYMWAIVIMVVFFLAAVVIANLIVYKPKNPGTTTRRLWFWVLCAATGVVTFVVNFIIGNSISVPNLQSSYHLHSAIATGVAVLLYILIGFGASKIFANSKVGTWFN
ncbi:MAG: hypothetical protein NC453_11105 [Muribaculum sp.]|nr:hypothetical protein [Muribaculum sp.]